jgi:hypothetical protein
MLRAAGAADSASSNSLEIPIPQLSANTGALPEVPMAIETSSPSGTPAAPATVATPPAAQSRNIWAVALAILVLLVGRFVLKRLRSRASPP